MSRISVRPEVRHGKPCVAGTRILVSEVLDLIAAGKSFSEITNVYFPDLSLEDVRSCVEYASAVVENEEVHFVEETPQAV